MSILSQLSSSLGRRDEEPNQQMAGQIAAQKDSQAIKELVANLDNKNKRIQNDCIKVLYEVATLQPALVSNYLRELAQLLDSKINRLQWGTMTAIDAVTQENPAAVYAVLQKILKAAEHGSVISKDRCMSILNKLYAVKPHRGAAFALLNELLLKSPVNQLPMYAEQFSAVVLPEHKTAFGATLSARLADLEKESKRKRIEKVILKLKA